MFEIETAKLSDINEIFNLQNDSIEHPYSYSSINNDFNNNRCVYFTIKTNDKICGFISLYNNIDTLDILQIVVDINYRGCGCGTLLINKAKEYAKLINVKDIMLEVRSSNSALKFYEKCGFNKINIRKKYYGNEDAIIYSYKI